MFGEGLGAQSEGRAVSVKQKVRPYGTNRQTHKHIYTFYIMIQMISRERGDNGMFITLVPKVV